MAALVQGPQQTPLWLQPSIIEEQKQEPLEPTSGGNAFYSNISTREATVASEVGQGGRRRFRPAHEIENNNPLG